MRGGTGGQGLPKYGGKGGRGGHVYAVANDKTSLKYIKSTNPTQRFIASNGCHSTSVHSSFIYITVF